MMKGVMMSATLSVSNLPATGAEASTHLVTSLVDAGKQTFAGQYQVTVRKIEPIPGTNQVRVTFFVTGEDAPAHDFTETGKQVIAQFLNAGTAGMRANIAGTDASAGTATLERIEAIEGGADDSESDSDDESSSDALSGLTAHIPPATTPTPPEPASTMAPSARAGDVPTLPVAPPIPGNRTTTADSSPAQQDTTRGEKAGSLDDADGPSEHEQPPHR
ncbi:MAG TPA: hypothetical protein VF040_08190 [Ktedonobacterales bacterium]